MNLYTNSRLSNQAFAKYLQMDNSGEKLCFKNKLKSEGINIVIEFTFPRIRNRPVTWREALQVSGEGLHQ
jgi:hypothetical protein